MVLGSLICGRKIFVILHTFFLYDTASNNNTAIVKPITEFSQTDISSAIIRKELRKQSLHDRTHLTTPAFF